MFLAAAMTMKWWCIFTSDHSSVQVSCFYCVDNLENTCYWNNVKTLFLNRRLLWTSLCNGKTYFILKLQIWMFMLFSGTTKLSVVIRHCWKWLNWVVGLKRMLHFTLSSFELIYWTVFDIQSFWRRYFLSVKYLSAPS